VDNDLDSGKLFGQAPIFSYVMPVFDGIGSKGLEKVSVLVESLNKGVSWGVVSPVVDARACCREGFLIGSCEESLDVRRLLKGWEGDAL
jgi:hypothetical protein